MKLRLYSRRPGFSLVEVVVATAIIVVLAAVFLSNDTPESQNDRLRYRTVAETLRSLSLAAAGYEPSKAPTSFHQVVGVYPGRLSDLTTPISTNQNNLCGQAYTGPSTTVGRNLYNWVNAKNPFFGRQLLTTGTPLARGFTVQDALILDHTATSSNTTWPNFMIIRMPSVTQRDAQALDYMVDGVVNRSLGIIRYTASDPAVVDYYTSITVINNGLITTC